MHLTQETLHMETARMNKVIEKEDIDEIKKSKREYRTEVSQKD